ncbi:Chymotrypsinogen B [Metarhizium anisopliae]|nr:Chymotrypsinogen B [Metarhizium anisopliae]
MHPDYKLDSPKGTTWVDNDIGIVKLATPTEKTKTLSKVVLGIHSREDCAKYQGVGDRDTIVCARGEVKNVCRADSGGPLFDQKTGLLLGVT